MAGRLSSAEADAIGIDSYYESAATRTKPNSTLFISFGAAAPPKQGRDALVEELFSSVPGYVGVRQVRHLCFVDYEDIKSATSAMMKYQNKHGMTIDYDKDDGKAEKRKRDEDRKTERQRKQASSGDYFCVACGTKALRTSGTLLSAMPTRGTDGAVVVDEVNQLASLLLEPLAGAQPSLVKREKGTEKQYRLGCRSCEAPIGYTSTPRPQKPGRYLYIHATRVSERQLQAQPQPPQPSPAAVQPAPAPVPSVAPPPGPGPPPPANT